MVNIRITVMNIPSKSVCLWICNGWVSSDIVKWQRWDRNGKKEGTRPGTSLINNKHHLCATQFAYFNIENIIFINTSVFCSWHKVASRAVHLRSNLSDNCAKQWFSLSLLKASGILVEHFLDTAKGTSVLLNFPINLKPKCTVLVASAKSHTKLQIQIMVYAAKCKPQLNLYGCRSYMFLMKIYIYNDIKLQNCHIATTTVNFSCGTVFRFNKVARNRHQSPMFA